MITRQGTNFETFSLINFMEIDTGRWDTTLSKGPDALTDLQVQIHTDRPAARVWFASLDGEMLDAQALVYTEDAGTITLTLTRLGYWTMIVVEYQP